MQRRSVGRSTATNPENSLCQFNPSRLRRHHNLPRKLRRVSRPPLRAQRTRPSRKPSRLQSKATKGAVMRTIVSRGPASCAPFHSSRPRPAAIDPAGSSARGSPCSCSAAAALEDLKITSSASGGTGVFRWPAPGCRPSDWSQQPVGGLPRWLWSAGGLTSGKFRSGRGSAFGVTRTTLICWAVRARHAVGGRSFACPGGPGSGGTRIG